MVVVWVMNEVAEDKQMGRVGGGGEGYPPGLGLGKGGVKAVAVDTEVA